jgi:translation initiation factor eIF-2B subunit epsilon
MADLALSDSSISTLASEKSEVQFTKRSPANSFATTVSEEGIAEQDFHQELSSSIFDSLQKGDDSTIIGLELQGLRLSSNASYHQVRRAIASAFTKRITQVMNDHNVMAGDAVPKVLRGYKKVFDNMVFDLDKAQKEDQVDFMLLMQKELTHQPKGDTILLHVSKELYSIEVIEEEAFDQWWANPQSSAEGDMERVRVQTKQFIEWLENAEEDGEDEESE